MPESKHIGHSRLFILFHFFIALPLSSFKRKRSWVFNIVRMLSPFQQGDVRSSCRPKWKKLISGNLLCCNKCRLLRVSCWWPFNVFMLQHYSKTPHCLPSLPSPRLPAPPAHPGLGFDCAKLRVHHSAQGPGWVWRKGLLPAFIMQAEACIHFRLICSFTDIFAQDVSFLSCSHISLIVSVQYRGMQIYVFCLSNVCHARRNAFPPHPGAVFPQLEVHHLFDWNSRIAFQPPSLFLSYIGSTGT